MIATLTALAVLAAAPVVTGDSQMDEVAARYSQSETTTMDRATGWFSGRCYKTTTPNVANANLIVAETRVIQGPNGPIFDRPVSKLMILGWRNADGTHVPPDFFDDPSPDVYRSVEDFVSRAFRSRDFREIFNGDDSLSGQQNSIYTRWNVRADNEYFYGRIVNTRYETDFAYCYFFKRVK